MIDNPNEQLRESDMPAKAVSRRRGCLVCSSCLLLGIFLPVILFATLSIAIFYEEMFDPEGRCALFVKTDEMPNIMRELAGEWMIEPPDATLTWLWFPSASMKNWQQTKIVLNEDGTCEIHNLTLYMTDSRHYKYRPEWTNKTFTGTWESSPIGIGGKGLHGTRYARIDIFCNINFPNENSVAGNPHDLGHWMVIKEDSEEEYRLRMTPWDGDPFAVGGIILKRVSLPTEHLLPANDKSKEHIETQ